MLKILSRYRVRNALVAGGLAALGALLVIAYVVSYRNNVKQGADLVTVYVAARDIPDGTDGASASGSRLSEEGDGAAAERRRRRDLRPHPDRRSLDGAQTILAGEQITVRQFHSAAQQGVLANISGNLRAITIPGNNDQLLAGIVTDGDHVDVLANIRYSREEGLVSRVAEPHHPQEPARPPRTEQQAAAAGSAARAPSATRSRSRSPTARPRSCSSPRRTRAGRSCCGRWRSPPTARRASRRSRDCSAPGSARARSPQLTAGQGTGSIGNGG